jgi:methylated-DNA-[protein]-cysteine S-methyltransferase
MKLLTYGIFKTHFGYCGMAWRISQSAGEASAVAYFQLPEASPEATEAKLARYCGEVSASQPPEDIHNLMHKVASHFVGDVQDFQDVALDLEGAGEFARQVYIAVQKIPAGQTRTYGEVAKAIQRPTAARAVGHALGRNPLALLIPCHRVLAANGNLCGFSAYGGVNMKLKMLELEGAKLKLPAGRELGAISENIAPLT